MPTPKPEVILDTGALVALYARDDPMHKVVTQWLAGFRGTLHTVEAVLTEVAFFLPARQREAIANLVSEGSITVHHPDRSGYARIGALMRKYADQDPDWADVTLIWLAETTGIFRIATVDVADFSVFRINGRKRFELALLR